MVPQSNLDAYYTILGVTESASKSDIKKAFMKLSLKHHPDKIRSAEHRNATPEEILHYTHMKDAYEVLSSDNKSSAAMNRTTVAPSTTGTAPPRTTTATGSAAPRSSTTTSSTSAPRTTATPTAAPPRTTPPIPTSIPASATYTSAPFVDSTASSGSWTDYFSSYFTFPTSSTSSASASTSSTGSWWGIFGSYFIPTTPILDRITLAVFSKNFTYLITLLEEHLTLPATERESHIPKLNWLMIEAATARDNAIALLLIKFGADINHYGEFLKLADDQSFECYFVDMLIHMDNFDLFAQILDRVDLSIYSVGLYIANNWHNPHLHHYPMHTYEYQKNQYDYHDIYEHNCRNRLLWCAIFCSWVLENNRADILVRLDEISKQEFGAKFGSCYFEDVYRFIADLVLRIFVNKPFTTQRIINKFLAVNNAPRFWQTVSKMQNTLDMRINIYSTIFTPFFCIKAGRPDEKDRLLHLNEIFNAIKNDITPIRNAVAWNYIARHVYPPFLFISIIIGFFTPLATYDYFNCDSDDQCVDFGSLLFLYAVGSFGLYITLTPLLARILSLGYLEIGGTMETVVNRAAINLVINQHAKHVINTPTPFVGYSYSSSRSSRSAAPDTDARDNDAYCRFTP